MSTKKQLVTILLPVISQNVVYLLGTKNKIKSKTKQGQKETIRTLINGTVEKNETPIAAAKREIYDKFDIILGPEVPAQLIKTHSKEHKDVYFVYIDKLFDFESFPLVNIAADVQELVLVDEDYPLSFETEKNTLSDFLDSDEIDEKFSNWERNSLETTNLV